MSTRDSNVSDRLQVPLGVTSEPVIDSYDAPLIQDGAVSATLLLIAEPSLPLRQEPPGEASQPTETGNSRRSWECEGRQSSKDASRPRDLTRSADEGLGSRSGDYDRPNPSFQETQASVSLNGYLSFPLRHHRRALIIPIEPLPSSIAVTYIKRFTQLLLQMINTKKSSSNQRDVEAEAGPPNTEEWGRTDNDRYFQVSFAEMQRMRIRKMQYKLIEHAVSIGCDEQEPDGWEDDLKQYIDRFTDSAEAIRDFDYMMTISDSLEDPFLASSTRYVDHYVIQKVLNGKVPPNPYSIGVPWKLRKDRRSVSDEVKRQISKKGFQERLLMATFGGLFLIAPMWLMVKRHDQNTSLVATTAFVAIFGFILAKRLDSAKEVMSSTAAYAAVLVVFVGLGGTPGSSS